MPYPATAPAVNPYGPQISFQTEQTFPPSAVYIGPDDALEIDVHAPSIASTVNLTLRRLTPRGEISSDVYAWPVPATGPGVQTMTIPPSEGYLLSAHCWSSNPRRGQVFVRFTARRNEGGIDVSLGHLFLQGYITANDHLGYPQSPTQSSLDGRGWVRTIVGTVPGLALNWTISPPPGVRWILLAVEATLSTAGAGGSSTFALQVMDLSTGSYLYIPPVYTQTVNTSVVYTWLPGIQASSTASRSFAPLPPELLMSSTTQLASDSFGVVLTGDQWSAPTLLVEEYAAS
jgi:hypothetical protein